MKILTAIATACIFPVFLQGCFIIEVVPSSEDFGWVDDYPVDTYVYLPYEVKMAMYDAAIGYSMPPVDRYGEQIYPVISYDPDNIPSFVRADFNGDGYYDYACMFSNLSWSGAYWHLDTKLLIVASNYDGYELALELELGTASGRSDIPVEEYWGIRLLNPGTHSITDYHKGKTYEKSIKLPYAGLYLGSIEPEERSVLVMNDFTVDEIFIDFGAVAKKSFSNGVVKERKNVVITESTLRNKAANAL